MSTAKRNTVRLLFSMMLARFFACAVLLAVEAYNAQPAEAHRLGQTAVRGGNIRYASGSDFDFHNARNWAVSQWNRLKIPILRDTSSTDLDLEFRQYPGTSGPYKYDDGFYDYTPPDVDKIWFNTRLWKCPRPCLGEYDREAVAVHVLGHVLNFAHTPRTRIWR